MDKSATAIALDPAAHSAIAGDRRSGIPLRVQARRLHRPVDRAVINVSNLRLRTLIGFNPEEREKPQDVVINIEIEYRLSEGVFDDRVAAALDYKTITKAVINHVENGHFLLLEKLVADVLALCIDYPQVIRARVQIDKPHALRFADSVSLTLEHHADDVRIQSEIDNEC